MALCSRWETAVGAAGEMVTAQKVEVGIGQNYRQQPTVSSEHDVIPQRC